MVSPTGFLVCFHDAFLDIDFWFRFCYIFDDFGPLLSLFLINFLVFWHTFSKHGIGIDIQLISDEFSIDFLILFITAACKIRRAIESHKVVF